MRALLASLRERREALVERSAQQRDATLAGVADIRRAVTEPLALGIGAALALLGAMPRARGWLVRGWVALSLVRRLLR
jgi:hypothetical protein